MSRAKAYLRVSTTGQAEKGTSLIEQRERVETYCRVHGHDLVEVVEDRGVSGGLSEGDAFAWESRPTVIKLMDDAETGLYDVLVVAKLDRLARDHATQVVLRRMLARHGVSIHSTVETNGDSAEARLQANLLSSVAEYERELIKSRLRLGKARRKAEGRLVHGRAAYGYMTNGGHVSPHKAEAPVVKLMFAMASRDRRSPGRIAKHLNAEGIPPRAATQWTPITVRQILRNDTYTGMRYGVRGHEALVSRRAFNEVQKLIEARRKR
ncbi:MAG: site-specific recombinase for integration and excision [Thermoleophilia bacterium]|nr:site-specific recombinase for integration and excision [Thermoleophilia bacterium]